MEHTVSISFRPCNFTDGWCHDLERSHLQRAPWFDTGMSKSFGFSPLDIMLAMLRTKPCPVMHADRSTNTESKTFS